jgi:hypothetical protein
VQERGKKQKPGRQWGRAEPARKELQGFVHVCGFSSAPTASSALLAKNS